MTDLPLSVGIMGCGDISAAYLERADQLPEIEICAVADLDSARARARAEAFQVPRVLAPEALVTDAEIQVVLNLTPPAAHGAVSLAALRAGKHVYSEKPLALDRAAGREILREATARHLAVGCAPDTFLGAGLQTALRLLRAGKVGKPVFAAGFMACHGHEHWHPAPEYYYQPGGGPLFDMGPYYLTALVAALGPVRRVAGAVRTSGPERRVDRGPFAGRRIPVATPTHVSGLLEFEGGAQAVLVTSFDVWKHGLPYLEIHGTKGSLSLPDPNTFEGPVRLAEAHGEEWREVPLGAGARGNARGTGLAEMARALSEGRPHRASGEIAFHVLDVMEGIYEAARLGRWMAVESTVAPPPLLEDPGGSLLPGGS